MIERIDVLPEPARPRPAPQSAHTRATRAHKAAFRLCHGARPPLLSPRAFSHKQDKKKKKKKRKSISAHGSTTYRTCPSRAPAARVASVYIWPQHTTRRFSPFSSPLLLVCAFLLCVWVAPRWTHAPSEFSQKVGVQSKASSLFDAGGQFSNK